jgi:glycosyl-4,4'-diaponeurosporenoate acyltransferase
VADGTVRRVLLDAAAWTGISVVIGLAASRVPDRALSSDTWLTAIRPAEREGRRWEHLGVRRWKDALPEAGGLFGGSSKSHLAGRGAVERQLIETRRAEWVHWALLCCGPLFALWNPAWLTAVMVAFGLAMNAPFIAVQRFNRARLLRVAERGRRVDPRLIGGRG